MVQKTAIKTALFSDSLAVEEEHSPLLLPNLAPCAARGKKKNMKVSEICAANSQPAASEQKIAPYRRREVSRFMEAMKGARD